MIPRTKTPRVFWAATLAVGLLVALGALQGPALEEAFGSFQKWSTVNAGWFLILTVNVLLLLAFYLLASPVGKLRIGRDGERPEFGTLTWLSMLFSAGMGIGLVFWGVAEPILHFESPPNGDPSTARAASNATVLTFLHWGLHAWGIYCIMGLAIG